MATAATHERKTAERGDKAAGNNTFKSAGHLVYPHSSYLYMHCVAARKTGFQTGTIKLTFSAFDSRDLARERELLNS